MTLTLSPKDKMIKLKPHTVNLLKTLKIVERESYDEVINRIVLQVVAEDRLELNKDSVRILNNRIKKVRDGQVRSFEDVLDTFRRKEVAKKLKEGGNATSGNKLG